MSSKRRARDSPDSDLDWASCVEADLNIADIEDGWRSCQLLSKKYSVIAEEYFSKLVGSLHASAPLQTRLVKAALSCLLPQFDRR